MKAYTLISIDHINQLIPAICALRHIRTESTGEIIIFTKPHIRFSSSSLYFLKQLLSVLDSYTLIEGSKLFKHPLLLTKMPMYLKAKRLSEKLRMFPVAEILFAHDVSSDFWNQAVMQVFPKAKRVCYGDALGLVYTQSYFTRLMFGSQENFLHSLKNWLTRQKRRLLYPTSRNVLYPQMAVLVIPCDPGGDFLNKCALSIPEKEEVQKCVYELASAIPEFQQYTAKLLEEVGDSKYLLILSNLTESKLTTLENEVALYQEILRKYVPKGVRLIVKPHPANNPECLKEILTILAKDYLIHLFNEKFYSIPIELADDLINNCNIISISYSSVSISYLFNTKIIHALDNSLIEKYFIANKMDWFMESNTLYLKLMNECFRM